MTCNNFFENNLTYLVDCYKEDEFYYYLENQRELYEKSFSLEDNRIILASFLICIFKMIFEWISDEEEE